MVSADAAAAARGRYVRANGLDVYYEEAGAGPPLVVLHGGTDTINHRPAFEARFRVSYPNLRGHGRTANPTGQMSFRLLADDAAAVIAALGLDRPFVVGYSTGAVAALELGMHCPDLVRALVLYGTPLELSPSMEGLRMTLGLVARADGGPDVEALERTRPDLVEWWQEIHAPLGPDHWKTLVRQAWPMWTTPLNYTDADFARVAVPTLVMLGDRDEIIPIEDGVRLYRGIPGAELMVLPGQSHAGDERAWLLRQVVLDFLLRQVGGEGEPAA